MFARSPSLPHVTRVGALWALLLATCAEAQPQGFPERTNIVLVMADDLGARELGCYGHPTHRTPHVDRLSTQGMRFRTAFATPLCTPSRVMVMTGKYGFRTGYWGNDKRYKPKPGSDKAWEWKRLTFAHLLGAEGYATGLVGKWRLGGAQHELVFDSGFDEYLIWGSREHLHPAVRRHWHRYELTTSRYWHPALIENGEYRPTSAEDYGPDRFVDWAIDFMRRHRDEPFFLYYPMCLVHRPHFEAPDPRDPSRRLPAGIPSYIEYMDHCVGRLVDALDELELSQRTLFVFTADNGTQDRGKGEATELGARVPFIARMPGTIPADRVTDELTDLTDLLPTFVELAGGELPAGEPFDGQSLVPTLLDPEAPHREWIFSYLNDERVLRTKHWLLETEFGLYDCGDSRDGDDYRLTSVPGTEAAQRARRRFAELLEQLPVPEGDLPERDLKKDAWRDDWGDEDDDE